jgi:hypothetical protein
MQKRMRDPGCDRRSGRLKRETRHVPPRSVWHVTIYEKKNYTGAAQKIGNESSPARGDVEAHGDIVEKIQGSPLIPGWEENVQVIDQKE